MHYADTFIQSQLHCNDAVKVLYIYIYISIQSVLGNWTSELLNSEIIRNTVLETFHQIFIIYFCFSLSKDISVFYPDFDYFLPDSNFQYLTMKSICMQITNIQYIWDMTFEENHFHILKLPNCALFLIYIVSI